jgi:DNA-binding NarL/FixJ family response regulator
VTKILIIDDDLDVLGDALGVLTAERFEVLGAEDGHRGLLLARTELPELILCGTSLPDPDGYAVLRALRAEATTAAIAFIFLASTHDPRDFRLGMNLGADDWLAKPVAKPELLAAIRARLERRTQQLPGWTRPESSSPHALEDLLGLTPRVAETLLWVIQGKTNPEIAKILEITEATVKKHVRHIFGKLNVETRTAASLRALEALNAQPWNRP